MLILLLLHKEQLRLIYHALKFLQQLVCSPLLTTSAHTILHSVSSNIYSQVMFPGYCGTPIPPPSSIHLVFKINETVDLFLSHSFSSFHTSPVYLSQDSHSTPTSSYLHFHSSNYIHRLASSQYIYTLFVPHSDARIVQHQSHSCPAILFLNVCHCNKTLRPLSSPVHN